MKADDPKIKDRIPPDNVLFIRGGMPHPQYTYGMMLTIWFHIQNWLREPKKYTLSNAARLLDIYPIELTRAKNNFVERRPMFNRPPANWGNHEQDTVVLIPPKHGRPVGRPKEYEDLKVPLKKGGSAAPAGPSYEEVLEKIRDGTFEGEPLSLDQKRQMLRHISENAQADAAKIAAMKLDDDLVRAHTDRDTVGPPDPLTDEERIERVARIIDCVGEDITMAALSKYRDSQHEPTEEEVHGDQFVGVGAEVEQDIGRSSVPEGREPAGCVEEVEGEGGLGITFG